MSLPTNYDMISRFPCILKPWCSIKNWSVFCKKGVLKNEECNFIIKETLVQVFSCEHFFYRTPPGDCFWWEDLQSNVQTTGKRLCGSLFFNQDAGLRPQFFFWVYIRQQLLHKNWVLTFPSEVHLAKAKISIFIGC